FNDVSAGDGVVANDEEQTDVISAGLIDVVVTNGALEMADGTLMEGVAGATIWVGGAFEVSRVNTGTAALSITTGGAISDVLTGEAANLTGGEATIRAGGAVGTAVTGGDLNTNLEGLDIEVTGEGA